MPNQNQIRENKLSICRPAWTSDNLYAFRDLHLQKKTIQNHFVKTQGFASTWDLRLIRDR